MLIVFKGNGNRRVVLSRVVGYQSKFYRRDALGRTTTDAYDWPVELNLASCLCVCVDIITTSHGRFVEIFAYYFASDFRQEDRTL